MHSEPDPSAPGDPAWVPDRLADLAEQLQELPQFVPAVEASSHVRRLLEELSQLADATQQLARQLPAWYRTNADNLYSRSGVFGATPADAARTQIEAIDKAVDLLGEADMRLLDASRRADDLELREAQRIDPVGQPRGLDEWWLVEEHSFAAARVSPDSFWETADAALWHASRLAERADRNTEIAVRRVTPEGEDTDVAARMRGRADFDS